MYTKACDKKNFTQIYNNSPELDLWWHGNRQQVMRKGMFD